MKSIYEVFMQKQFKVRIENRAYWCFPVPVSSILSVGVRNLAKAERKGERGSVETFWRTWRRRFLQECLGF